MFSRKAQSSRGDDSGASQSVNVQRDAPASAVEAGTQPGLAPSLAGNGFGQGEPANLGASLLHGDKPVLSNASRHWFSGRLRGYLFAVFGMFAVSPDAVMLRFIRKHATDAVRCEEGMSKDMCNVHFLMVLLCLKYAMMFALQLLFVLWSAGGARPLASSVRSSWRLLVVPTVFMLFSQIGFTTCLLETTAADAIMFASLNPLWAALMGCFFLKDKVAAHTMVAMVVAAGAVALAFLPSVLGGAKEEAELPKGASGPTLHGNLIALATGATLAAFITGSRAGSLADPNAPMSVAPMLGSLGAALVCLPGAILWTGSLADPAFLLFILGDAVLEASYDISMPFAAREITSAEVALVLLLEIPVAPLFVWIFFGEVPPLFTVIGAGVLVVSLLAHGLIEARREFAVVEEIRATLALRATMAEQAGQAPGPVPRINSYLGVDAAGFFHRATPFASISSIQAHVFTPISPRLGPQVALLPPAPPV
jgi:drug/metabolite transporter (DMT)-like permease